MHILSKINKLFICKHIYLLLLLNTLVACDFIEFKIIKPYGFRNVNDSGGYVASNIRPSYGENISQTSENDTLQSQKYLTQLYETARVQESRITYSSTNNEIIRVVDIYLDYYKQSPSGPYAISSLLRSSRLLCQHGFKRDGKKILVEIKKSTLYNYNEHGKHFIYVENECN